MAQARLFALLIRDLVRAWQARPVVAFRDLPAYERLILGAYACGFVCRDINGPAFAHRMEELTHRPDALRSADFTTVRAYVHTIMRAERHLDAGCAHGGGCIYAAVESHALDIVAERLEAQCSEC